MNILFLCANPWQNVINSIPCLCWGIIGLVALYLLLKFVVQPCMTSCHEKKMKAEALNREESWHEKGLEDKEKALDLKIKEFNELTLHQKLLDKVIEKSTDEKVAKLEDALKELKNKYDSLDGEIEQIIIKKKQ